MKRIMLSTLLALGSPLFSQNIADGAQIDKTVEERLSRITTQAAPEYDFRKEPGYYIPSFSVGFRIGAESRFSGKEALLLGFYTDIRLMRFTRGFGLLRLLVESPVTGRGSTLAEDALITDSSYIISGGFGGGFSFLDTRFGKSGIGHVATFSILAMVGARVGTLEKAGDLLRSFGGIEMGFRYQYYFHRYASFQIGLDIGFRFGVTSSAVYGWSVGFAF